MTDSERNPAGIQASRVHARPATPAPYPNPTTSIKHATSAEDVLVAALDNLRERGITNPEQFASMDAESILGTIRWFDAQKGRVGTGILVNELRAGGKHGWQDQQDDPGQRAREYGWQIADWLNDHFPEFKQASGQPHPAAIASVIRLHYRDGKRQLTKERHGREIRAAVKAWKEKWES